MPLPDKGPAPYAPGHAIEAVIDHVRRMGLPETLDADFLGRLVSDAYVSRTRRALVQLDLVDEDTEQPTPTLRKIKEEKTDELPETLQAWFNEAYQPVLTFVSPEDDIEKITDQFRPYTPDGQRDRMVQLFLSLAHFVGLIDAVPKKPRGATAAKKKPQKSRNTGGANTKKTEKPTTSPPPTQKGNASKERYLDLLIGLAEKADGNPSPELLDRIERVLGVPKQEVLP